LVVLAVAGMAGLRMWARQPGFTGGARAVDLGQEPRTERVAALAGDGTGTSVRSRVLFALYVNSWKSRIKWESGKHWLGANLSAAETVEWLARTVRRPVVRVLVPEGFNRFQIAERLQSLGVCSAEGFKNASADSAALSRVGLGERSSAEGHLFPATYEFHVNGVPGAVMAQMVQNAEQRRVALAERYAERLATLQLEFGWGMEEVISLASIIEKETGFASERGKIASVFFNRLRDPKFLPRRRLQSDPTAAYGCLVQPELESCAGLARVTPEMLRDRNNRYNTYMHEGLPPTPIGNPGEAAIEAVLAPADTPYLFFVVNPSRPGEHLFSRTLEEHRAAMRER
jgi:UPF0755 protein